MPSSTALMFDPLTTRLGRPPGDFARRPEDSSPGGRRTARRDDRPERYPSAEHGRRPGRARLSGLACACVSADTGSPEEPSMQMGAILPQAEIGTGADVLRAYLQAVQDLGYDFVVTSDHVLGADPAGHPGWN